jgi:DnaK suppressor protein
MHDVGGDPDEIRLELQARLDSARERVEALARPPELGTGVGFGKRVGDGTTEAVSRLTDIGVGTSLERVMARTQRALSKLDDGTYGTCDRCGNRIPAGRLKALPESVLCLACAKVQPRTTVPRR